MFVFYIIDSHQIGYCSNWYECDGVFSLILNSHETVQIHFIVKLLKIIFIGKIQDFVHFMQGYAHSSEYNFSSFLCGRKLIASKKLIYKTYQFSFCTKERFIHQSQSQRAPIIYSIINKTTSLLFIGMDSNLILYERHQDDMPY